MTHLIKDSKSEYDKPFQNFWMQSYAEVLNNYQIAVVAIQNRFSIVTIYHCFKTEYTFIILPLDPVAHLKQWPTQGSKYVWRFAVVVFFVE